MNKPKIIAHRGANRYAPQNTIPAFEKAVELGADGTETDVHITKDGHIVICHNDTVDEMSNGTGAIGSYMFEDIRKLDFGSKFSKDFAGVTLPTVEEYLECMKKSDKLSVMNIEIKPNKSEREDIVRKTIEAVKDYGLFDELLISSFDYKMLVEAKKYDPKCKTAYLYPIYGQVVRRWFFQPLHLAKKIGCDAMHPHKAFATKTLVKRAHAAGQRFMVGRAAADGQQRIRRRVVQRTARLGSAAVESQIPAVLHSVIPFLQRTMISNASGALRAARRERFLFAGNRPPAGG